MPKNQVSTSRIILITIGCIIILQILSSTIEYRKEMKGLYEEAIEKMDAGNYSGSIQLLNEIPSSYRDVESLHNKAATKLINECESLKQNKQTNSAIYCFNEISSLGLSNFYKTMTGNNVNDTLNMLQSKKEHAKRTKMRNKEPFVGMSTDFINDTSWGFPSEIKTFEHIRGDTISYTWYFCKYGKQYKSSVSAKNGNVFRVTGKGKGIYVSDILQVHRKCPE